MDEADLMKERLQAITDKRRIQENIAIKRREIEEEKLKLQYMKKKALREQWLMDGLTHQSEEEQEATRIQARYEQQQNDQLQSNIFRIEKEIEALETMELNISANEEVVVKRLKEVEGKTEDIVKELSTESQADCDVTSSVLDTAPFIPLTSAKSLIHEPSVEELKRAMFAMEISMEHDKRTGKSQVISAATIIPDTVQGRGLKLYDDGWRSVYVLCSDESTVHSGVIAEMTQTEVEELLQQATDKRIPTEVHYHRPVYSLVYKQSGSPSTPMAPHETQQQDISSSAMFFQTTDSSRSGAQINRKENHKNQVLKGLRPPHQTYANSIQLKPIKGAEKSQEETMLPHYNPPGVLNSDRNLCSQSYFGTTNPNGLINIKKNPTIQAALVSVKARFEGIPTPIQLFELPIVASLPNNNFKLDSDDLISTSANLNESSTVSAGNSTTLKLLNTYPEKPKSTVNMIFLGYENAEDHEKEDIQAELVIIGSCDNGDAEAKDIKNEFGLEEGLSYHPEGYKSKFFKPKMGIAKVTGYRNINKDLYADWDGLGHHKPSFLYKPRKPNP
ncbi:uncharacterized protein V6R79_002670 [Siganus canaliculatus]